MIIEMILKNKLNVLYSTLEIGKHECIENAELKSATLSVDEINDMVLKVVGSKKKLGKKTKTRKKCQLVNKNYKEKFKKIFRSLLLANPLRGSRFICKICKKNLPYFDTIAKKMVKIEPLNIKY